MEDISKRSLNITRLLNAPIDLVWKVWSTPDLIKIWWGPDGFTNTISEMDFRTGGRWKFVMHGPDGTDYRNEYTYREIVEKQKIVLEHDTGPKFTTTVHFYPEGEKTRMEWQGLFATTADLEKAIQVFRADEGLKQNVNRLEQFLINQQ